jgi:hypothetical protein
MKLYIIHSAKSSLEPLRDALKGADVKLDDAYEFSSDSRLQNTLVDRIRHADGVIAVIDDSSSDISFEMGVAVALNKLIFALVAPGQNIPTYAFEIPYVTTDLSNKSVPRLALQGFLEQLRTKSQRNRTRNVRKLSSNQMKISEYLDDVTFSSLRTRSYGKDIEDIVFRLLTSVGITVERQPAHGGDPGVDFAVWSDDLRGMLPNPVLIESKVGELDRRAFNAAYSRLSAVVSKYGTGTGLLLYLSRNSERFNRADNWSPKVLAFDLEDFANELKTKRFGDVLLQRRNQIAHGLAD